MVRWMYVLSFSPRESSMSRRIASNATASASRSASLRWAYSVAFVIAIDASPTFRRGGLPPHSRAEGHTAEIRVRQHRGHVRFLVALVTSTRDWRRPRGSGIRDSEFGGQPAEQDEPRSGAPLFHLRPVRCRTRRARVAVQARGPASSRATPPSVRCGFVDDQVTRHRAIRDDLGLLFQLGWQPGSPAR
jgi:hypothetical protein